MTAKSVFISHASDDKPFVLDIQQRLAPLGMDCWVDAREMAGGSLLLPEVVAAIERADYVLVVISPNTINSTWVTKEVQHALQLQKTRSGSLKVIPLLLPGIKPTALGHWFPEAPIALLVENEPGGLDRAMPALLAALDESLPTFIPTVPPKPPVPVAELILELTDPKILHEGGKRRATANATLIYNPAQEAEREIRSKRYHFTAPLGPIETGDLTWYLESYHRWPTSVNLQRAQEIEKHLPEWGKLLFAELHKAAGYAAFTAWDGVANGTARCITIRIDRELTEGTPDDAQKEADEAATLLLALPWELIHDDRGYLFQDVRGVRVRRQLPNRYRQEPYTTKPPVRILLVSPRPESKGVGYINHRISARPLVEALTPLGDLAELTVLTPPTFPVMVEEMTRAKNAGTPYHVVHFDGHGVYNPQHGLGQLVFEDPADANKPGQRNHKLVDAKEIAEAIRDCRVPLFFLEACQSAMTDADPTASVAGQLLEGGVASVVAMSHSVLVETAKRFVTAFYGSVLKGERVGQAMLAGQRILQGDTRRGKTFAGEFHLHDWFVPVLYQEEYDPQLVAEVPAAEVRRQRAKESASRLGALPPIPEQTFVGRSRELLYAERMLRLPTNPEPTTTALPPYVVIQGEGGEGKTTLAAELARWLVSSGRFGRAAFVSFEKAATADMALSLLGNQLVPNYESKAGHGKNRGWLEVERALIEQPTVIVLDNMESVLPPAPSSPGEAVFEPEILDKILALCKQLRGGGRTRLVFTSRETLPKPFDHNTIRLGRLPESDAIELVANTLRENVRISVTKDDDASEIEIKNLIEVVGGHARALVLIAREVARTGVNNAAANLDLIMRSLHKRFPNDRERSLLASVKLSLDRLPPDTRQRIRPLGVLQNGISLIPLGIMLHIDNPKQIVELGQDLVGVGLAEELPYGYFRFDPAFAPALLLEMGTEEKKDAYNTWAETMQVLADYLYQQQSSAPYVAFVVAAYEMPNLLAALEHLARTREAATIILFATRIETLARSLGRRKAVAQAERIRKAAARLLRDWRHETYLADASEIDRLVDVHNYEQAVAAAEHLLQQCELAGEDAYPGAPFDIATAYAYLARARHLNGANEVALVSITEAESRFTVLAQSGNEDAARMVVTANSERAGILKDLGRWAEATNLYEENIKQDKERGNFRSAAVAQCNLSIAKRCQAKYDEALQLLVEAKSTFDRLNDPTSIATCTQQIGLVYTEAGNYPAAEQAFQEALQMNSLQGNEADQADSLNGLGLIYSRNGNHEQAVRYYSAAATIYIKYSNRIREGQMRNNMARSLLHLNRHNAARAELAQAIACLEPFGISGEISMTYATLCDVERATNNEIAAQKAREKAIQAYINHRRNGADSQGLCSIVCVLVAQALLPGQPAGLLEITANWLKHPDTPRERKPLFPILYQILSGSRNQALTNDPNLHYMDAAELRMLLETLAQREMAQPRTSIAPKPKRASSRIRSRPPD